MLSGLDRRIAIERRSVQRDGFGEGIEVWTTLVDRRPAKLNALRGDERFVSDQKVARVQVEFIIRYSDSLADLNPLDRIVDEPFVYDIISVTPIGRREGWRIVASARAEEEEGGTSP